MWSRVAERCEREFVSERERSDAEAEVARRSRVMAGLDETDGAALEASIVEAMRQLRTPGADSADATADPGGVRSSP